MEEESGAMVFAVSVLRKLDCCKLPFTFILSKPSLPSTKHLCLATTTERIKIHHSMWTNWYFMVLVENKMRTESTAKREKLRMNNARARDPAPRRYYQNQCGSQEPVT